MSGYFNMMMIVDISGVQVDFGELQDELTDLGKTKIGVEIKCQKEEIFEEMHRL